MRLTKKKPSEMMQTRPEIFCKNFLPIVDKSVNMLFSGGGVGKSYASIRIAIEYALETGKTVSLWLTEDPEGENYSRFVEICTNDYYDKMDYLNDKIKFITDSPVKIAELRDGNFVLRKEFYETRLSLYDDGMVILDPLLQFAGCDENSNTGAGVVMGGLKEWAKEEGKVILLIHHSTKLHKNKDGGFDPPSSRGAGEWQNGCRAVYTVGSLGMTTQDLMFTLVKNNGVSRYFRNHETGDLSRRLKIFGTFMPSIPGEDEEPQMVHKMSFADHNSVSPDGFVSEDVSYFYDLHLKLTSGRAYSQYEFDDGYRLGSNNLGAASVICLDFDDGSPTLEQAVKKFSGIKSLIITTRSHQKAKGEDKPACDRFRVIIPLESPLTIPIDQYSAFLDTLYSKIGHVDPSTKDIARFFFSSPPDAEFYYSDSEKLMDWKPIYEKMNQENIRRKLEKKLQEERTIKFQPSIAKGTPQNTLPASTLIESKNGAQTLISLRDTLSVDEKLPCKCIDGIDHGGQGRHHLSAFVKKDSNGNVFYHCSGGRCAHRKTLWCED